MSHTTNRVLFTLLCIALVHSFGCGDDGGTPLDSGTDSSTDSGSDGGAVDCASAADGTPCGGELLCIGGSCQPTSCGDRYVDEAAGETCDDGNNIADDGCEPTSCQFTCVEDSHCDDADPCNGAETCNARTNRCQLAAAADGAECMRMGGEPGTCAGGYCVSPGCGNGAPDSGEECDDGANGDNTDGCRDDCQYTCDAETPCADADACNGEERCIPATHTCSNPPDLECDDGDPCTTNSCDATDGCVYVLQDADGDGYAPAAAGTCTTAGLEGGDCDDGDVTRYPTAPESCDGIDNDCDGAIDNDTMDIACQRDVDGDGYGNAADVMSACTCPAGYVPPHPSGRTDCDDTNREVNPGVTRYSSNYYCPGGVSCDPATGSFDWNCSGSQEMQYPSLASSAGCTQVCVRGICYCTGSGWTSSSVPSCGNPLFFIPGLTNYRSCASFLTGCRATDSQRRQTCR